MSTPYASSTLAEMANRLERRRQMAARLAAALQEDAARALEDPDLSDLLDNHNPGAGTNDVDRVRSLQLAGMAERAAAAADEALARIAAGNYGTCARCRERIPLVRLRALPEADLCVGCKIRGGRLLALAG